MRSWLVRESEDEHEAIKQAVAEAFAKLATAEMPVIVIKPTIQINYAVGGGATVNVRNES